MSEDVYVDGYRHDQVRPLPGAGPSPSLGAEAALMALDDAGLKIQDMQALYCGNLSRPAPWWASASSRRSARPASPS